MSVTLPDSGIIKQEVGDDDSASNESLNLQKIEDRLHVHGLVGVNPTESATNDGYVLAYSTANSRYEFMPHGGVISSTTTTTTTTTSTTTTTT